MKKTLFYVAIMSCVCVSALTASERLAQIEARAAKIIWAGAMQTVQDAIPTDQVCFVDLTRLKAVAGALDEITGLRLSAEVRWENVPLDRDGLHKAAVVWQAWFDAHGKDVRLLSAVAAIEKAAHEIERGREVP